jgi:hypothetical protein
VSDDNRETVWEHNNRVDAEYAARNAELARQSAAFDEQEGWVSAEYLR